MRLNPSLRMLLADRPKQKAASFTKPGPEPEPGPKLCGLCGWCEDLTPSADGVGWICTECRVKLRNGGA